MLSKDDVEALSASRDEPGWLRERRLEAFKWFESHELPNERSDEFWRYTNFRRLKFSLDDFKVEIPDGSPKMTAEQKALIDAEGERAGYVVESDGRAVHTEVTAGDEGVIFCDFATAVAEHPDLVQEHLFTQVSPEDGYFKALHACVFTGGTFLYVPRGVSVALPFEAHRHIETAGRLFSSHTLVVVEEGARVTYFERLHSPELETPSIANGALELVAGPGSQIDLVSLQEFGAGMWHFAHQRASVASDVTFRNLAVVFGGRFSRNEIETRMGGKGSSVEMLGLFFAEGGQHFDFRTLQEHAAESCNSDLLYKGALKDVSRSVYSGMIRVDEGAAGTDAYQANRNLVLSDHAKADSKPELEILNNDVRCTHGASVGQVDEEELFYLESRGIPPDEAQRLIVDGFFEEVVGRIENDEITGVLRSSIGRKVSR